MLNIFKRNKAVKEEEKASFARKNLMESLRVQESEIYTIFDKYAIEAQSLENVFCEMPNAKIYAEKKDAEEEVNIGWNMGFYERYLQEKNNLVREKFNEEAYLLTYKVEVNRADENEDDSRIASMISVIPFTLYSTSPVVFEINFSNLSEVYDSMVNTFFVLEEEKEFMETLSEFDQINGFIGYDEEKGHYFKFLRNDLLMLAIIPKYDYNSLKTESGVPFEESDIDAILTGIDYTQKSITFVLEELLKTTKQAKEFETYIKELNSTGADDFEMYLESRG